MTGEARRRIGVVIIHGDTFARQALRRMIHEDPEIEVTFASGDDDECIEVLSRILPQVAIIDLHADDDDDVPTRIQLIRLISAVSPSTACLVLAASDPAGTLLTLAFHAGARGCVRTGNIPRKGLSNIVRRLANGEYIIDSWVAAGVMRRAAFIAHVESSSPRFSKRESDWLVRLANGSKPVDIAHDLGMSEASVQTNLANIAAKFRTDYIPWTASHGPAKDRPKQAEEMAPWPTRSTLA